jgi:hypothetical protein
MPVTEAISSMVVILAGEEIIAWGIIRGELGGWASSEGYVLMWS